MGKLYLCALGFGVINLMVKKRNYAWYLAAILVVLVFFSYHLDVTPTMDLYRHIGDMELYHDVGLEWVLENRMDSNPLAALFFWAFSNFENPKILPAFAAFVCYGVAFYLIIKCSKRYNLEKNHMNMLLLFFCLNFYYDHAITNIRIYLCYALYAFFMYNELVENRYKKLSWIIYIACCFMHYAMLPFLGFRILLAIKNKLFKENYVFYIALIFIIVGGGYIVGKLRLYSGVFATLAYKMEGYSEYTVFGKWQQISSVLRMGAMILFCAFFNKCYKNYRAEQKITFYLSCIALMLFLMINEYQLVYRTPNFFHYIGIIPMAVFLKGADAPKKSNLARESSLIKILWIASSVFTITYQVMFIYPSVNFKF